MEREASRWRTALPTAPSGTITFLFTDIEGSTKLWEHHTLPMKSALGRHDAIMREHIERNHGYVFKTVGDAFCAAFETALYAMGAALDAQRALQATVWEVPGGIRVRMALHTGTCEERDGDYFGQTLNRVARLLSIGYGGQTLVSLVTSELLRDLLPEEVQLRDLGVHRLKDLMRPESVFQLVGLGLPSDFPPPRSLDNHPNNLPIQPNPFIGREKELEAVRGSLCDDAVRVLTLTGTGGTGKTRLSLQAAADLVERFPDGVFFVDLSAIDTPAYVIIAIARTLGVRQTGTRFLRDGLIEALRDKSILLILDNFEQVIEAAPRVVELLSACPQLKLLVTSREALRLRAERVFRVPPLRAPKLRELRELSLPRLHQYEAVALFIERAVAARNDFTVTNENAPAVAEICARLDGLPLAIELAAARVDLLSPQAILQRIGGKLKLLASGATDLPFRQRTLRATIDWSYRLLTPAEQMLFREMSVFAGGCTLEAAETVCACGGPDGVDVLQVLSSLVAKSLLGREERRGGALRFTMFESLKEYGTEILRANGGDTPLKNVHATYYRDMAERLLPQQNGPGQREAFDALEADHDNIVAALDWMHCSSNIGEELALCGALVQYWRVRGHLTEGREACDRALASGEGGGAARAAALRCKGVLSREFGDYAVAAKSLEGAVLIYRDAGDRRGQALSLYHLGMTYFKMGSTRKAEECFHRTAECAESPNAHLWGLAENGLGLLSEKENHLEEARFHFEAGEKIFERLEDRQMLAHAYNNIANVFWGMGDRSKALTLSEAALALWQEIGNESDTWLPWNNMGYFHSVLGEHNRARECYEQMRSIAARTGNQRVLSLSYSGLGDAALSAGDPTAALAHASYACDVAKKYGDSMEHGVALRVLGEALLAMKDLARARECFAASIEMLEKHGELEDAEDLERSRKGYVLSK